ncbi:MAG: hypothetical protein A2085_07030 [Gemmatimonadetes bacterium GWC2_71_10]|nr:MAG: hypothetical protein A2085_07030 [Gemmatimonadetes bacterium GWC2_71_10]
MSVRYPGAAAPSLDDATLTVRAGECVGLVGPNGAGKTTALRAVLGIAPLAGGTARVFGRDVREWPRRELARAVGVLSQREEPAFPLTVREAVVMGRYPHLDAWQNLSPRDEAAARAALERTDVADLAGRWVGTLSGGEWQRVRLARALAQQPRALVLDEPSASLDLRHEMELFELVVDLVRRDGLAALVVSHHLNAAARFCDRLVLFDRGRVVADAPPADVLAADRLSAVFGWPVAVHRLPDGVPQLFPERRPLGQPGTA